MAHVGIKINTSETLHRKILSWLNNRRYPYTGKVRCGYNRPYVAETKDYDIRIKKECLPMLLQDLHNLGEGNLFKHSLVKFFLRLICKFSGMKYYDLDKMKITEKHPFGWSKVQLLYIKDDPIIDGEEHL